MPDTYTSINGAFLYATWRKPLILKIRNEPRVLMKSYVQFRLINYNLFIHGAREFYLCGEIA